MRNPGYVIATQAATVTVGATAEASEDARDAARYRWLLNNYARGDGYNNIDAALNDGEPEKDLSPAIDAAIKVMSPASTTTKG